MKKLLLKWKKFKIFHSHLILVLWTLVVYSDGRLVFALIICNVHYLTVTWQFKLGHFKFLQFKFSGKILKGHNSKSNAYLNKIKKIRIYVLLIYTSHFLFFEFFWTFYKTIKIIVIYINKRIYVNFFFIYLNWSLIF